MYVIASRLAGLPKLPKFIWFTIIKLIPHEFIRYPQIKCKAIDFIESIVALGAVDLYEKVRHRHRYLINYFENLYGKTNKMVKSSIWDIHGTAIDFYMELLNHRTVRNNLPTNDPVLKNCQKNYQAALRGELIGAFDFPLIVARARKVSVKEIADYLTNNYPTRYAVYKKTFLIGYDKIEHMDGFYTDISFIAYTGNEELVNHFIKMGDDFPTFGYCMGGHTAPIIKHYGHLTHRVREFLDWAGQLEN